MKNQGQGVAPMAVGRDSEAILEFISMAVHDLREPLRGIRLGTELLAGDNLEESRQRGARYLQDGAARMETLIRDIAEYCYGEARDAGLGIADLEMSLLEAKTELAVELKNSGSIVTHDSLPAVRGNAASLAVLLRCLLGNACKFRGNAAPRIHVGAVQQDGEWVLSVRDNGAGFNPAYRERIFRPFERLNGKQFPGSGLGLALAKRIVERHGGQIWAESVVGEGSTFRFSLPLIR